MDWKVVLAFAGWLLAISQFIFNYREIRRKNDSELLEKTLGYFDKGSLSRSIAISLVEGIWLKRKINLDVICPVLISQATFLLTELETKSENENRNLVRILILIEKILPHVKNNEFEKIEICEALLSGALSDKGIETSDIFLRRWYKKFNNNCSENFDIELESRNT